MQPMNLNKHDNAKQYRRQIDLSSKSIKAILKLVIQLQRILLVDIHSHDANEIPMPNIASK